MSDLTRYKLWMRMRKRNGMSSCLWIILLLCCCGGCGNGFSGNGFGNDSCLWIILLLCCWGAAGSETTAADADPSGRLLQTNKGVRGRIPHASFLRL